MKRRRHRGRFPEIKSASARLRKFCAGSRQICPRRKSDFVRRSDPAPERTAGDQPRARSSRLPQGGHVCRRRRLRSGDDRRSRDLRAAAPIRGRDEARLRERRAGDQGRRAHRGDARPRACGARARFVRPRFQFRWANLGRARLRRTPGRKRVQPEITPRHSRVSSHQPFKPLPTARAGSAPVVIRTETNAEHCPLGGSCSQFKA